MARRWNDLWYMLTEKLPANGRLILLWDGVDDWAASWSGSPHVFFWGQTRIEHLRRLAGFVWWVATGAKPAEGRE